MIASQKVKVADADAEAAAWNSLNDDAKRRLAERIKEHAAPSLPYQPTYDNVFVYRFPSDDIKTMTEGGLHIPEIYQEEEEPKFTGLLLQAGLEARDHLRTHGVLLGDIVFFGRFEGWEAEFERDKKGKGRKKILQLKAHGLLGSADLMERMYGKKPTMRIVYKQFDDGGMHVVEPIY